MPDINAIKSYLLQLQTSICQTLAVEDGQKQFHEDAWERPDGGHGRTHVLENGAIIEKCGVNFSHIRGKQLPPAATTLYPELAGGSFQAMGISVIVHPRNPYAPTTHMNVRFFIAEKPNMQPVWWFGGGFDLTPYYGFVEDCIHWHQMAKQACIPFGADLYPNYKKAADDYFYLKHRQEGRGIGGIFFDNVNQPDFQQAFAFMRSVGDHFMQAYQPLLARRKHQPFGEREREFQLYRRGRYVEFNLIYDRGTVFGLQFGGRIESILVSLPSPVTWHYNWQPEPNTDEARLYTEFLVSRDWV